jgi:hypothetical protein
MPPTEFAEPLPKSRTMSTFIVTHTNVDSHKRRRFSRRNTQSSKSIVNRIPKTVMIGHKLGHDHVQGQEKSAINLVSEVIDEIEKGPNTIYRKASPSGASIINKNSKGVRQTLVPLVHTIENLDHK